MSLLPGDLAPWFTARITGNPNFRFDSVGGRYNVLCFFGTMSNPDAPRIFADVLRDAARYDGSNYGFFGISADQQDESLQRLPEPTHCVSWVWDTGGTIS